MIDKQWTDKYLTGKPKSEEHRRNMSKSKKGRRPLTPEEIAAGTPVTHDPPELVNDAPVES